jgi:hypothetical protein
MTFSHLPIMRAAGKSPEPPERVRYFVHYELHTGQIKHIYTVLKFQRARCRRR